MPLKATSALARVRVPDLRRERGSVPAGAGLVHTGEVLSGVVGTGPADGARREITTSMIHYSEASPKIHALTPDVNRLRPGAETPAAEPAGGREAGNGPDRIRTRSGPLPCGNGPPLPGTRDQLAGRSAAFRAGTWLSASPGTRSRECSGA
ncbi:hypothetical protein Ppa06_44390 [Planomonospora parontospora subsp. parontospora]|uniref:Uncharacterized protein n=2 Tax=Planomonospora parontospora TaxID=58119 RepID=A0AA37BL40_9ACTN|nr:hypothetical protein GCM10010126_50250 [Planomonospora parontospora]GII10641.1 hypothetical protein Ppa06_44390 [Planomonospora parontospora subsp. parontospora]